MLADWLDKRRWGYESKMFSFDDTQGNLGIIPPRPKYLWQSLLGDKTTNSIVVSSSPNFVVRHGFALTTSRLNVMFVLPFSISSIRESHLVSLSLFVYAAVILGLVLCKASIITFVYSEPITLASHKGLFSCFREQNGVDLKLYWIPQKM